MSGDTAKLWVPGRTEAVTLGKDLATPRQTQGYALFLSEARRPLGLLTPGGGWVDGAALPATVGQIDGFDEVHGRLWLHDADGKLLAVFNPDGEAGAGRRRAGSAERAAHARLAPRRTGRAAGPADAGPLPARGARRPGAGRRHHRDRPILGIGGLAGRIRRRVWRRRGRQTGRERHATSPAPRPACACSTRAASPWTCLRSNTSASSATATHWPAQRRAHRGPRRKLHELPDFFEAEVAGPPGALPEHRRRGRSLGPVRPSPARRSRRRRSSASACSAIAARRGRAGREPRRHHRHTGQVDRAARVPRGAPGGRRPVAAAPGRRADRRIPTPVRAGVPRRPRARRPSPRIWRWRRTRPAATWPGPTSACGRSRATRRRSGKSPTPTSRRWAAGWASSAATGFGYVDSSGSWQIAPERLGGSVFHGSPARALRLGHQEGQEDRLVDTQGNTVATLPVGDWSWPTGSDWLIRQRHVANQGMVTDYFDTDGKPKLSAVPGRVGAYSEAARESAGQRPGARGQRAGQARRPGLRRAVAAPRRLGGGARGPALRLR